eukprot:4700555-Amphidinium_carterae.2
MLTNRLISDYGLVSIGGLLCKFGPQNYPHLTAVACIYTNSARIDEGPSSEHNGIAQCFRINNQRFAQ